MEDDIEKGYDFIIVARNRADLGKTQSQIQGDIRFAMRKLGLIKCKKVLIALIDFLQTPNFTV